MGNFIESLVECFGKLVDIVKENPKESAAVAVAVTSFMGGYGAGYREGRKDNDKFYAERYLK